MPPILRLAVPDDASGILNVYAPYIRDTAVTFEYTVPPLPEFTARIEQIQQRFPYFVCEENGCILGYAYADAYGERAAFGWSAELSVYVCPECHRRGIAGALCRSVIDALRLLGYHTLYSRIVVPNPASLALHHALGFHEEGRFPAIGFKLGQWRDLAELALVLSPRKDAPLPTRPVSALTEEELNRIFYRHLAGIRPEPVSEN